MSEIEAEPQSKRYCWIITRDHLWGDSRNLPKGLSLVGTFSPYSEGELAWFAILTAAISNITKDIPGSIEHSQAKADYWQLFDSDGISLFEGFILGEFTGTEPLFDIQDAYPEAARIEYPYPRPYKGE